MNPSLILPRCFLRTPPSCVRHHPSGRPFAGERDMGAAGPLRLLFTGRNAPYAVSVWRHSISYHPPSPPPPDVADVDSAASSKTNIALATLRIASCHAPVGRGGRGRHNAGLLWSFGRREYAGEVIENFRGRWFAVICPWAWWRDFLLDKMTFQLAPFASSSYIFVPPPPGRVSSRRSSPSFFHIRSLRLSATFHFF